MDTRSSSDQSDVQTRTFLPGSACLYLKLYCSTNNCDYLLRQMIRPFVTSRQIDRPFTKWFFIRYGDPDWHLRLRFFGQPDRLLKEVLPHFSLVGQVAHGAKRLYKIDIGTYNRELERYGGRQTISVAESIFEIDSLAAVELVNLLESNEFLNERWKIALVGVDRLLEDFGLNVSDKLTLIGKLCGGFDAEFGVGGAFKESLSKRFRVERSELIKLLAKSHDITALQSRALSILERRSFENERAIKTFKATLSDPCGFETFAGIISSFVHMHVNRVLRSSHRAHELVIYNFLLRLYRSINARGNKSCLVE